MDVVKEQNWISLGGYRVLPDRGRKEYTKIQELAESILEHGLVQPIVLARSETGEIVLVAGGRRTRACMMVPMLAKQRGLQLTEQHPAHRIAHKLEVPYVWRDEADELTRKELELEENLHREDLHWQDRVEMVTQIDELKKAKYGDKGRGYKDGWSTKDTAQALGVSDESVRQKKELAKKLRARPELKERLRNKPETVAVRELKQIEEAEKIDALHKEGKIELRAELLCGDARDLIRTLGDSSVDLICTDPPFGISNIEDMEGKSRGQHQSYGTLLKPDDNASESEVRDLMTTLFPEFFRVLKPGAHLYMFFGMEMYDFLLKAMRSVGFWVSPVPLIWDKKRTTGAFQGYNYAPCYEPIFFGCKPFPDKGASEGQGRPLQQVDGTQMRTIIDVSALHSTNKIHPFEKPVELLQRLINASTNKGDVVLDPFGGSASTLRAAEASGRSCIAFEKDPERHLRAQARLLQQKLAS